MSFCSDHWQLEEKSKRPKQSEKMCFHLQLLEYSYRCMLGYISFIL